MNDWTNLIQIAGSILISMLTMYLSNKKSNRDYIKEENDRLNAENDKLHEENDKLREKLNNEH